MPIIITICWYPPGIAEQVAQRYLELLQKSPVPDVVKRLVLPCSTSTPEGIEVVTVDEVKSKDMGAAWEYGDKFLIAFRDIEGFRWQKTVYNTITEGLKLIGMG
ncbi:MAG: hypothetical protein HWN65_01490 [Candidatus Helarchaeota archaeon]|nr:hypothetical protein [Candidatus Helarchaeota archaeon]